MSRAHDTVSRSGAVSHAVISRMTRSRSVMARDAIRMVSDENLEAYDVEATSTATKVLG